MKWKVIDRVHTVSGWRVLIVPINCFELKEENDIIASLPSDQKLIADEIVSRHNKIVDEVAAAFAPASKRRVSVRTMTMPRGVDPHEIFPETEVAESETQIGADTEINRK